MLTEWELREQERVQRALRDLSQELIPLNELHAKVMMMMPIDYVLENGELTSHPRPSDAAKNLLEQIQVTREMIVRKHMEKRHELRL